MVRKDKTLIEILEKDYKWREIYPAVCNVVEMDPLSSCELGEKFDLKKDKDIRLGSQGDFSKSTIKVSFQFYNTIVLYCTLAG